MASGTRKKAADELGTLTRELGDILAISDDLLGAAAPAQAVLPPTIDSPSTAKHPNPKPPKKGKYPCGKCDADVTGNSVSCNSCDSWFHYGCIEGMTKEYFDNCRKMAELNGYSPFLCKICRKVLTAVKKSMKELRDDLKGMADRIMVLELEKEALAQKVEKIELKADKANDRVVGVEKEVATGMQKAKEEVRNDVNSEMLNREERVDRVVVYGLEETKEEDLEQWTAKEKKKVEDIFRNMGVQPQGEIMVKYRAGRPREEGAKPRPLIVKLSDDETRLRFLSNAPKLSRIEATRHIFLAPDLTPQQREEDRKKENELKEEAAKKTEAEKNGGGEKTWIVVGVRGRRRVAEAFQRDRRRQ